MTKRILTLTLCFSLLLSLATGLGNVSASETLTYTVSYGATNGSGYTDAVAADKQAVSDLQNGIAALSLQSASGIPYQIFEVDVSGASDTVTLALTAETVENERVALKVYNVTTNAWDTVDTAVTKGQMTATVDLATYAADGKLKAMAAVDFVANGSNRLLWSTDQQHYTEFEDLHATYYGIHEYMVGEYQKGDVAYVINTGDIVDDTPNMATSAGQWIVADKAFTILDEANVPYGIVTGNHDVGDYPINNYSKYLQYFNAERYENRPWFGGSEDDNKCHYDLVTVGNVDFIILYIGYGLGDQQEVIKWANDVLSTYSHRNAILCTHQYLSPTTLERKGRGEIIHNTIVTQNDNVVMVLSGHYDGAGYKTEVIDDRTVQQVIADYQFVQAEDEEYYADAKDPLHHIGSVAYCNGEGYIREIIVEGNAVSMYAFSPITDGTTPFGARDDLELEVQLKPTVRQLITHAFAVGTDDVAAGDYLDTATELDDPATNLQALIDRASELKKRGYEADSFADLKDAVKNAKSVIKGDATAEEIGQAYMTLDSAIGFLEEKTDEMDPEKLTTVIDFDTDVLAWENANGPKSLTSVHSYIDFEALDNGGFSAKAGSLSPNSWPAIKYVEPITFTPEDGKVYLYLDLEAGSTWSCYPTVIQGNDQFMGRWNYVIDGAYKLDGDAGCGSYVGVYDVTQALVDLGVNMEEEMTISFVLNVVPGPVTINKISLLTGAYPTVFSLSGDSVLWIVLIIVGVAAVALILFAILYKPKKKTVVETVNETTDTTDDADATVSENNDDSDGTQTK